MNVNLGMSWSCVSGQYQKRAATEKRQPERAISKCQRQLVVGHTDHTYNDSRNCVCVVSLRGSALVKCDIQVLETQQVKAMTVCVSIN